jgi:BirA family biotin operon repressor/biotin-[acetyl-CoA-carboxylase] ligase
VAAGVAVCEALCEAAAVSPGLKWPNDVLLEGRKVAGILAELAASGHSVRHAVVGIGLNVNHRREDFPPDLQPLATSLLLATGRLFSRDAVAAALFNQFDRLYEIFCRGDGRAILDAARARSVVLGRQVELIDGEARWRGHAMGLDDDGALLVRDAAGVVRCIHAGDISLRVAESE